MAAILEKLAPTKSMSKIVELKFLRAPMSLNLVPLFKDSYFPRMLT